MERLNFHHDGLKFSYLDSGGPGCVIIALHAMLMEAGTYAKVAAALAPQWRVVSLDQRGHGASDHATDYSRSAFVGDIAALLAHIGVREPVVLMGNSLGATNAFQFAARFPDQVRALINEEGPAEEDGDIDFIRPWAGVFKTRDALASAIGERLLWSVEPSFRQVAGGWTLAFSVNDMLKIMQEKNGDWWSDWLASTCPALVIRGTESRAVQAPVMDAMARRRPGTTIVALDAGHVAHEENLPDFLSAFRAFLDEPRDQPSSGHR